MMILNAIICTWNESDIIYSTVKHAFAQVCSNVFIIDNGSTDETVEEAIKAGARFLLKFESKYFDENLKIKHLNAAVEAINNSFCEKSVWWLYIDADEFPVLNTGHNIIDFLNLISVDYHAIHGSMYNHVPTHAPYFEQGKHPVDYMPVCMKTEIPKVPLLKYDKGRPHIYSMGGAHSFKSEEFINVIDNALEIHHFNYREPAHTYARLGNLLNKREDGTRRVDWMDEYAITSLKLPHSMYHDRYHGLHDTYTGNHLLALKTHKLCYSFKDIVRWYNTVDSSMVESQFSFDKNLSLGIYCYFLEQYDIALCRFHDALQNAPTTIIPWITIKMAECFFNSDKEACHFLLRGMKKTDDPEILAYIKKYLM